MLLYLSLLGILLSIILVSFNAREFKSSVFLGLFFFLISTIVFNTYVLMNSKSVLLVSIFFLIPGPTSYLTGPAFFWYIRSILSDETRLKRSDIWHFVPMAILLVFSIPYFFSTWAHKQEIATHIVNDIKNIVLENPITLNSWMPGWIFFLIRPVTILGYIFWSAVLFVRHKKNNQETKILVSQYRFMDKWLIVLFSCATVLTAGYAIIILASHLRADFNLFYTVNIPQFLSILGLILLLISPFFFPGVLYGFPRFHNTGMPLPEASFAEDKIATDAENKNGSLDFEEDYLAHIAEKIELCMNNFQPYLSPGCNLAYCSRLIKVPSHHLAYYFREIKQQTFTDYRNQWRVNHAKQLIVSGKNNDFTIEAIGLMSGFSSRDAFIASFKKQEGIPPSIYFAGFRKQVTD